MLFINLKFDAEDWLKRVDDIYTSRYLVEIYLSAVRVTKKVIFGIGNECVILANEDGRVSSTLYMLV